MVMLCWAPADETGETRAAASSVAASKRGKQNGFTNAPLPDDLYSTPATATDLVEQDSADDDGALDDGLVVRRHVHEHEPGRQHADQQCTRQRTQDGAATSRQAGPADDHRGNGVELVPLARVRLARVEPSRQDAR